jgi:hypothetical protein
MASYPFGQFTRDVDSPVRSEQAPKILLQLVHPLMKALLAQRNWLELVFPQMTKTDMLALGTCGDHIPDFHLLIRDHHAVDSDRRPAAGRPDGAAHRRELRVRADKRTRSAGP